MQDTMVAYQGRMVSTRDFRVFVYGKDNQKKLINSWWDFEEAISSGEWSENPIEEAVISKPKSRRSKK